MMVWLGLEPRAARFKAQTNPLSYGATLAVSYFVVDSIRRVEMFLRMPGPNAVKP